MRTAVHILFVSLPVLAGCGGSGSGAHTNGDAGGGTGGTGATGGTGGTAGSPPTGGAGGTGGMAGTGGGVCGEDMPPNEVLPDTTDPEQGNFTMDEALVELPDGPGPLRAIIETSLGTLTCTFHAAEAPIGAANFIGLARGRRAFRDPASNMWVRRPFYDGLTFHRVIPGFVAQGGDPVGNGTGGPGYQFPNEIAGLTHASGTLAYANAGADTNGSQFYICEAPQPQLDSDYTIFGECAPLDVVTDITHVPTNSNDTPLTPIIITKVTVTRCAP